MKKPYYLLLQDGEAAGNKAWDVVIFAVLFFLQRACLGTALQHHAQGPSPAWKENILFPDSVMIIETG